MAKRVGIIDISSDNITLYVAERHSGSIRIIDTLVRDLSLGQDTFLTGSITYDSADKTAKILNGFKQVLLEYNVDNIQAIATTAMREAANRPYILDQLRIKTGLDINIIDIRREKIQINKLIFATASDELKRSALMLHLGGGSIGLSLLTNGEITDTLTISTGALRMSKQFESRGSIDQLYYTDVIRDYLEGYLSELDIFIESAPKGLVLTGVNVDLIAKMCGIEHESFDIIERSSFTELYKRVKNMSPQQISEKYGVSAESADVLLPTIIILNRFVKYTDADILHCPHISLGVAYAYKALFPRESAKIDSFFDSFAITSAKQLCKKFNVNKEHADRIVQTALTVFDRTKKYHGLGKNERLLLHIACLLQNCGKFISSSQHNRHSFNIINGLNIAGIDDEQRRIIAYISLYHNCNPVLTDDITQDELVLIAKLSVILRIANSINKGYNKGFEKIETVLKNDQLVITVHTHMNIELEKWSFMAAAPFFREVYGIDAVLKKRSVM